MGISCGSVYNTLKAKTTLSLEMLPFFESFGSFTMAGTHLHHQFLNSLDIYSSHAQIRQIYENNINML